MVVILTTKNNTTFTVVLINNSTKKNHNVMYELADNVVATKWYKAMKHLRNIKPHDHDSGMKAPRDIQTVYKEFCLAAGIEQIKFDQIDQPILNRLHELFMEHADRMSRNQSKHILYEFHQAIHQTESAMDEKSHYKWTHMHIVSYSDKAGLLQDEFPCNKHYSDSLIQDNIYLLYSQSGKKPYNYFFDGEPADFEKVKKVMKPHHTFIPNWFICLEDREPIHLPQEFWDFFEPFRPWFLENYGLEKWDHEDEYGGVLLAKPLTDENVSEMISKKGYTYSHIEL